MTTAPIRGQLPGVGHRVRSGLWRRLGSAVQDRQGVRLPTATAGVVLPMPPAQALTTVQERKRRQPTIDPPRCRNAENFSLKSKAFVPCFANFLRSSNTKRRRRHNRSWRPKRVIATFLRHRPPADNVHHRDDQLHVGLRKHAGNPLITQVGVWAFVELRGIDNTSLGHVVDQ